MKAIQFHEFGGRDVLKLEEVAKPEPAADEVLIKVYASGVNPVDWKMREGKSRFPANLPLIPGWDVSGVVEKMGSDVKNFKVGDEVYSRPDVGRNGTYAEYVVVKVNLVSLKPKSIDHIHAAAVPLAGVTAWQALFEHGQLKAGQKVLIHAASGGVGSFAVQFAKAKGAYVIGTTSTSNVDFVKKLGADEVIDYKKEKFEDKLKDIDLVIDPIGGDTQKNSLKVLKHGGRLITTVKPENEEEAKEKNIHIGAFMAKSYPADLQQIAQLIDEGKVKPEVSKVFPLNDAKEAQKLSEEGHTRGKIVIQVV